MIKLEKKNFGLVLISVCTSAYCVFSLFKFIFNFDYRMFFYCILFYKVFSILKNIKIKLKT